MVLVISEIVVAKRNISPASLFQAPPNRLRIALAYSSETDSGDI